MAIVHATHPFPATPFAYFELTLDSGLDYIERDEWRVRVGLAERYSTEPLGESFDSVGYSDGLCYDSRSTPIALQDLMIFTVWSGKLFESLLVMEIMESQNGWFLKF